MNVNANSYRYYYYYGSRPAWESALYGAAGVAHHAELTRLLLERGADPNDGEVTYHAPETYDNAAMRVLSRFLGAHDRQERLGWFRESARIAPHR